MEKLNACEAMLQVYDAFYVAFRDKFSMLTVVNFFPQIKEKTHNSTHF